MNKRRALTHGECGICGTLMLTYPEVISPTCTGCLGEKLGKPATPRSNFERAAIHAGDPDYELNDTELWGTFK